MPTLPVVHGAVAAPPDASRAGARPFSQSTTDLAPMVSLRPPLVGHPVEPPEPSDSANTIANPRARKYASYVGLPIAGLGPNAACRRCSSAAGDATGCAAASPAGPAGRSGYHSSTSTSWLATSLPPA